MATYVIGDVQGCYATLRALMRRIRYARARDCLWFVGDLVNRGPDSLGVLRWISDNDERAVVVLGNHDLHLISVHEGIAALRENDTLEPVLDATDGPDLLRWLRCRPLLHRDGDCLMVHAGLLPAWTWADAERVARDLEAAVQSDAVHDLLQRRGPTTPQRSALAALTRLRTVNDAGTMVEGSTDEPEKLPPGFLPWYAHPQRRNATGTILCGHWAAAGFRRERSVILLDSGCVWGGALTAYRLDDGQVFHEPSCER